MTSPPQSAVVLYMAPLGQESVARQQRRLQLWGMSHGVELVGQIVDDEPAPGVRPGLLTALDHIRRRQALTVAVVCAGVIAPDVVDQEAYVAEVQRAGGRVHMLTPPPADEQRETVRAYERARLRWERASVAHRLHAGREQAAARPGWFPGGRAPLGTRLQDGQLVEDAEEMAVVQRMRVLRRGGHSYERIAAILSAEMYPTKEGSTTWHREQVRRALMRHGDAVPDEPSPPPGQDSRSG